MTDKTSPHPIPNHYTPALSERDLQMVRAIPSGGNWKDIPHNVPSRRVDQIRESFRRGEGSRSTYYGRLSFDNPAYTINTYFNRPGNGCFIHYSQDRLISQREAARLQSFPDSFVFTGPKSSINKQIGNAVPPLLAYQIARRFPEPGEFVDLFSGAGGLSLGFTWAGWKHIASNDIDPKFVATAQSNLGGETICGDITDPDVVSQIVDSARGRASSPCGEGLVVLGGPPCQGFSTAGKRRSMDDARNHLFTQYAHILSILHPSAFIFENVEGLRNMKGGRVLEMIQRILSEVGYEIDVWRLNAADYGVPQKRRRVFLVGTRSSRPSVKRPLPLTQINGPRDLLPRAPLAVTTGEAISDLPPLTPGEDRSDETYTASPNNSYQAFARGLISPFDLIRALDSREFP